MVIPNLRENFCHMLINQLLDIILRLYRVYKPFVVKKVGLKGEVSTPIFWRRKFINQLNSGYKLYKTKQQAHWFDNQSSIKVNYTFV
jgi:hypothetical protein